MQTFYVLLIEDSELQASIIKRQLDDARSVRFDLTRAGSLAEGFERFAERPVDAILLDLNLPDSGGLETFARVQEAVGDTPIVILTSTDDMTMAAKAVEDGAESYLVKDQVDSRQLARSLHYAMQRHRACFPSHAAAVTARPARHAHGCDD